jgi:hypothetical protein
VIEKIPTLGRPAVDIVDFLRARLDEDEAAAKLMAEYYPPPWDLSDRGWMARVVADAPSYRDVIVLEQFDGEPEGGYLGDLIAHVGRHDPARVLREVEGKRRIFADCLETGSHRCDYGDLFSSEQICQGRGYLLESYVGHPDFKDWWKS